MAQFINQSNMDCSAFNATLLAKRRNIETTIWLDKTLAIQINLKYNNLLKIYNIHIVVINFDLALGYFCYAYAYPVYNNSLITNLHIFIS